MGGKDKIWAYKENLKYNFYTRPTISYDEDKCGVSINDASMILKDMRNASEKTELTLVVLIMSFVYAFILLIAYSCVVKNYFSNDLTAYDANTVFNLTVPTIILSGFSLVVFIVAAINFSRVFAETSAMEAWSSVDRCVEDDMYMQMSEVER